MFNSPWTIVALLFPLGAQMVVFLKWLHRRIRDDEVQRAFVRDLALRHLPSIYTALHTIAKRQGIKLDEVPTINFVDFRNGGWH